MAEPQVREPETTWGVLRALIQAGTGAAFVLEEMPRIGAFLFVVATCTVVYETVQWRRARRRRATMGRGATTATAGATAATATAVTTTRAPRVSRPAPTSRHPAAVTRRASRQRVRRGPRAAR